jgi:hypothetical protein
MIELLEMIHSLHKNVKIVYYGFGVKDKEEKVSKLNEYVKHNLGPTVLMEQTIDSIFN